MKCKYLYQLSYNEGNEVFYIGLTANPAQRIKAHKFNHGKNITMTVFTELNCLMPDCVESFIIRKSAKMGFNLKNDLRVLVSPYEMPETNISFDSFLKSTTVLSSLHAKNGIYFYNQKNP